MSKIDLSFDIESLEILSQTVYTKGNIVIEVQSEATDSPCHKCGKTATKRYGYGPFLTVKHLPLFPHSVEIL